MAKTAKPPKKWHGKQRKKIEKYEHKKVATSTPTHPYSVGKKIVILFYCDFSKDEQSKDTLQERGWSKNSCA